MLRVMNKFITEERAFVSLQIYVYDKVSCHKAQYK